MRFDRSLIADFKADQRGAIAIIFGLSVFILVGAVGLAIDMSRAYNISQRITASINSAALAAAKLLDQGNATDEQVRARAISMMNAHLASHPFAGVTLGTPDIAIDRANSTIDINVDVTMPTTFAQVINIPSVSFNRYARGYVQSQRVELALVLDVTGSMNSGGRLAAMKMAAKDVIDTIVDPANPHLVRISLVPYAAAVNVGTYADVASGGDSLDGCVMERLFTPYDTNDAPGFPRNFAVNGQLNSGSNGRYVCPPATLLPLNGNVATLKNTIDSYGAAGWTAGHIGLSWGWNTISANWSGVFTGSAAPGPNDPARIVKAILLMTDGEFNTAYTGGTSEAEQIAESAARTNALCTVIKAQNIRIFTVAFQAPTSAQALLQGCSSSGDHFDATNGEELRTVFKEIATSLLNVRLKS